MRVSSRNRCRIRGDDRAGLRKKKNRKRKEIENRVLTRFTLPLISGFSAGCVSDEFSTWREIDATLRGRDIKLVHALSRATCCTRAFKGSLNSTILIVRHASRHESTGTLYGECFKAFARVLSCQEKIDRVAAFYEGDNHVGKGLRLQNKGGSRARALKLSLGDTRSFFCPRIFFIIFARAREAWRNYEFCQLFSLHC